MASYAVDLSRQRLLAAVALGGSLVVAHLPSGVGLPCPLRAVTGVPCPFCGLTTSLRALAGGHLAQALAAAPLGIILALVALVAVLGRLPVLVRLNLWLVLGVLAAEWSFELVRFHVV